MTLPTVTQSGLGVASGEVQEKLGNAEKDMGPVQANIGITKYLESLNTSTSQQMPEDLTKIIQDLSDIISNLSTLPSQQAQIA